MDARLNTLLTTTVQSSASVIGVTVGDSLGLTISTAGKAAPGIAAYATSLLHTASILQGVAVDDGARAGNPVVRIETDQTCVVCPTTSGQVP